MKQRRYVRLAEAVRTLGVSRTEILEIARTPGQTLVRKITPAAKNSPFMVDLDRLEAYLDDRARASVDAPRRRRV